MINLNDFHLPISTWVYFFQWARSKILYIGKAKNIQKRVQQYFNRNIWVWKEDMVAKSENIEFIITKNEEEALVLESNLIKKHKPKYNTLLKRGSWYVYIKIDNTDFPKISTCRYRDDENAIYIWPKPWRKELERLLQTIRKLLKYRTCSENRFRKKIVCTDFTFWLCKWYCALEKTKKKSIYDKEKEYCQNIKKIIVDYFEGNPLPIKNLVFSEINDAINSENFEWAAILRDNYIHIDDFSKWQDVEFDTDIDGYFIKIKKLHYIDSTLYFMIFAKFTNGKLIDIVKLKNDTDDFLDSMKIDKLITDYEVVKDQNSEKYAYAYLNQLKKWKNAEILDKIEEMLDTNLWQYISLFTFKDEHTINNLLSDLQKRIQLKNFPYSMVCLDISHIGWWYTAGWLSCMKWWFLVKSWYRRYNIQNAKWCDDYAAMEEVIIRYFWLDSQITKQDLNLFIIDGGKWQLNVIKSIYKQAKKYKKFQQIFKKIDFISIWKWEARTLKWKNKWAKEIIYRLKDDLSLQQISLDQNMITDRLLLKLQSESHRFANNYRKKLMSKDITNSFK